MSSVIQPFDAEIWKTLEKAVFGQINSTVINRCKFSEKKVDNFVIIGYILNCDNLLSTQYL